MKKIKIGIPRAILYYRYGVLWKNYFESLGLNVVLSPETNHEILSLGINNSIDESCLSYKIYLGHALYLSKICDYTRLNGLYDNLKELIPKDMLLNFNIEHTHHHYQSLGLIKIGFKFTKNPFKIIYSYLYAKNKQKKHDQNKANEELNKLSRPQKKILILSHFYNIKDKYITNYLLKYLESNNIIPIMSNNFPKKLTTEFSQYFSNTLYWKYSKEMIGSLYYCLHQVDNLAIAKNKNIPTLNLLIDENITDLSLETKLESFIDIINGGKNE